MPRQRTLPEYTAPVALVQHERRLDRLERRPGAGPASAPPANPTVGQRWLVPHATGHWEMAWTGTVWAYAGGHDLFAYTAAEITIAATTYPASAQGPNVSLPRAGTFTVSLEAKHRHSHTGILFTAASYGPTGSSNAALVGVERGPVVAAGAQPFQGWTHEPAAHSVGLLSMWFRSPNGAGTFYAYRRIAVRPITLT